MYEVPDDWELPPHQTVEHKDAPGVTAIKLLAEPYSGIIVSYGKVSFDTTHGDAGEEHVKMNFEYTLHEDAGKDMTAKQMKEFEVYLGDFLRDLIIYGIKENNIAYTGGVDESRENDPIQSDQ
jgi:hypothetical protein